MAKSPAMRRLLLLATLAAGLAGTTGSAHATLVCLTDEQWSCVYTRGLNVCHTIYGGENWTEYCVGREGVQECVYMYPGPVDCRTLPGPIT